MAKKATPVDKAVKAAQRATQAAVSTQNTVATEDKVVADVTAAQDELVTEVINGTVEAAQTRADKEAADVQAAAEKLAEAVDTGDTGDIREAMSELAKEIEDLEDLADARLEALSETYDWHDIQRRLKNLGFYKSTVDGIRGPKTNAAIVKFKQSIGYKARDYYGPLTHKALMGMRLDLPRTREAPGRTAEDLPWMAELVERMGWHERNNNDELEDWLAQGTVGVDPAKIPWCGDLVETAIYSTLPDEPKFANPLLARNFMKFGRDCKPQYGCIGVFWRTHKTKSISGHVAFLIGYDPVRKRYRMRGGNQSNMLRDSWIDADRLLGTRWPVTYPETNIPLPTMNSKGQRVSRNEA